MFHVGAIVASSEARKRRRLDNLAIGNAMHHSSRLGAQIPYIWMTDSGNRNLRGRSCGTGIMNLVLQGVI